MGEDWLPWEVEIIVEDFLAMLIKELRGELYNKSEHRRNLLKLLTSRNDSSIEFKHQNISAVMLEMGYPCISGYKPAANFQRSLSPEVVERCVYANSELTALLSRLVEQTVEKPVSIGNILSIQVDPPVRAKKRKRPREDHGSWLVMVRILL